MPKIEQSKITKRCCQCDDVIWKNALKVRVGKYSYCVFCGYEKLKENIKECEKCLSDLRMRFGKKIAVKRLLK